MTLEQLFEHARDRAADMFNHCGEVLPMWHAVTSNDEHLIIATPWSGPDEKQQTVESLRAMFEEKHVKQLAFVCEAWVLQLPADTDIDTDNLPVPSEHPDRREVLRINVEDNKGNVISGSYYILRPEHGKPKLSKFNLDKYDALTGRMTGLLKHVGTKH